MPDLEISIADRTFLVTCQAGEEPFLLAAAKMLDVEAGPLQAKVGRLPEVRMLVMAGLMLADRTATLEEDLRRTKARIAEMERLLKQTGVADPSAVAQPSAAVLSHIAAKAEDLADQLDALVN